MSKLVDDEDLFDARCTEPVAEVSDLGSAQVLVGILLGESVRAKAEPVGLVAGFPRAFRVLVDPRQAHRARWVLQPSDFTDAELDFLATGKLGGAEGD